jgi:hypothetical protein
VAGSSRTGYSPPDVQRTPDRRIRSPRVSAAQGAIREPRLRPLDHAVGELGDVPVEGERGAHADGLGQGRELPRRRDAPDGPHMASSERTRRQTPVLRLMCASLASRGMVASRATGCPLLKSIGRAPHSRAAARQVRRAGSRRTVHPAGRDVEPPRPAPGCSGNASGRSSPLARPRHVPLRWGQGGAPGGGATCRTRAAVGRRWGRGRDTAAWSRSGCCRPARTCRGWLNDASSTSTTSPAKVSASTESVADATMDHAVALGPAR